MRRASPVLWSIALLGLAYGLALIGRGGAIDGWSLLVAGWLFLYAESAYLALETGPQSFWPWRHVLTALATAGGSSLAGIVLLALNQSLIASGPLLMAAGVIAAVCLLALVAAASSRGTV